MAPTTGLYHAKVNVVGGEGPAREALVTTLKGTGARLSWQILCAPGDRPNACYLNVYGFPQ